MTRERKGEKSPLVKESRGDETSIGKLAKEETSQRRTSTFSRSSKYHLSFNDSWGRVWGRRMRLQQWKRNYRSKANTEFLSRNVLPERGWCGFFVMTHQRLIGFWCISRRKRRKRRNSVSDILFERMMRSQDLLAQTRVTEWVTEQFSELNCQVWRGNLIWKTVNPSLSVWTSFPKTRTSKRLGTAKLQTQQSWKEGDNQRIIESWIKRVQ